MIGRWRRRGKPAQGAQQRILRFVVIGHDVEIIAPGTRQVLFGLNRLKNNADTEFFAFLPEAQCLLRIGKRLFCRCNLVGE